MDPEEIAERLAKLLDALESRVTELRCPLRGFLTVEHAAEYCDLSVESIRRLYVSGKLTALRPVDGRIVIERSELDAFIRSCNQTPRGGRGRNK